MVAPKPALSLSLSLFPPFKSRLGGTLSSVESRPVHTFRMGKGRTYTMKAKAARPS